MAKYLSGSFNNVHAWVGPYWIWYLAHFQFERSFFKGLLHLTTWKKAQITTWDKFKHFIQFKMSQSYWWYKPLDAEEQSECLDAKCSNVSSPESIVLIWAFVKRNFYFNQLKKLKKKTKLHSSIFNASSFVRVIFSSFHEEGRRESLCLINKWLQRTWAPGKAGSVGISHWLCLVCIFK